MSTSLLILTGAILLFIPFVLRPIIERIAENKKRHLFCVTNFLNSAPTMVSNSLITDPQAKLLMMIADKIDEPRFVLPFMAALIEHRKKTPKRTAEQLAFSDSVDALPDDLRTGFNATLAHGLLAISYSSFLFGGLLRAVWLKPVGMPERSTDAPIFAYRAFAHC